MKTVIEPYLETQFPIFEAALQKINLECIQDAIYLCAFCSELITDSEQEARNAQIQTIKWRINHLQQERNTATIYTLLKILNDEINWLKHVKVKTAVYRERLELAEYQIQTWQPHGIANEQ